MKYPRNPSSPLFALAMLATVLSGCSHAQAGQEGRDTVPTANAKAPQLPASSSSLAAPTRDFETFLAGVREDGLKLGISPATLDGALAGLKPIERVIELDRRQPEFTLTFDQYVSRIVTPARVAAARAHYKENKALLDAVARRYGVQPRFIVALWSMETNFGRSTGGFSVIASLATLAYDGRRSDYFRSELLKALEIIDQGNITPAAMKGSWAGAMGQNQFMPSTFLNFAVDWDGDGKRDIWHSKGDVFASAANFLKQSGWRDDETWGRRVRLPPGFASKLPALTRPPSALHCGALSKLTADKPLAQWQAMGVRRADGGDLPQRGDIKGALALPEGPDGPALLVYGNFLATLKWNCSISFAAAVGSLADEIAAR
jgi:membrane-bound lytic murein transglycosylase B